MVMVAGFLLFVSARINRPAVAAALALALPPARLKERKGFLQKYPARPKRERGFTEPRFPILLSSFLI
jgi:hypothetical protein